MYEDEDYRNVYDDDFDGRNARRRRPRYYPSYGGGGRMVPMGPRPYPAYPTAPMPPAPWTPQQPMAPVVDRWTGTVRLGLILDAATQILASMASLPGAPTATGHSLTDTQNLIAYQKALAEHAKRDEQIRTVGALARLFLA
jgi:hypothetical protein